MRNKNRRWIISLFVIMIGVASHLYGQSIADRSTGYSSVFQSQSSATLLDKTFTIDKVEGGLEQVLRRIEKESGVTFVYRQELLTPYENIEINEPITSTVGAFLDKIFQGIPLAYLASENYIIISNESSLQSVAPDTVTGTVTDATSNETLPGVNIMVKSTNVGTSTDGSGNYTLLVPSSQDTLVFSFIGYETVEEPINGRSTINVEMRQSTSEMDEVIVTGVLERDNESFTGSHVTVDNEELQRAGNDNVFQSLRNVDPSFNILEDLSAGSDPNALPDLQLRGQSTFEADQTELDQNLKANFLKKPNQPLFILDGFKSSAEEIFDLEMNRIESVTILKDASAKALYGSQAANGVVVVETKKLYATDPVISYNNKVRLELPDLSSYNLTNSMEKLRAERIDGLYDPDLNNGQTAIELQQLYNARRKLALQGLDTDWMAKPLRNGIGQEHSLAVELGTEDLKVRGNVSFGDEQGVMKGSYRQNLGGNIKASYRAGDVLLRNTMRINKNSTQDSPYGTFNQYARMNPYWRATNQNGSIPYYAETGPGGGQFTNPLYNSTLDTEITTSYLNFTNNFYLEWNILPKLKTTARVGVNTWNTEADEYYPAEHTRFENEFDINQKGSYQVNNGERTNVSGDLNVKYTNEVGKHFYLGNVGFNIREEQFSEVVHQVEGFPSQNLNDVTFGRRYPEGSSPTGISSIDREIGFLAIGSYMYDSRYMTDVTVRTSASSQFGADKRWAQFWSLGLGWNVHNESFMEVLDFLDRFKIRGSVGSTGNQNFNTNASIATYNYYLETNYDNQLGSFASNLANPALQWETKFDYNAGFDANIGNLTMRFDYYESYTENLVTDLSLPPSTGFSSVKENIGEIKNSGFELSASYLVWQSRDGFLSVNASGATNENEIINLSEAMQNYNDRIEEQAAQQNNSDPVIKYEDGRSMNDIWAVRSLGIDPATGNEIYLTRDGNTTYQYNPQDMVVVGNSQPKYRGNFGFNGEYKGFGASVIFRFLGGGQMYNQTLVNKVENVNMNFNVDKRVLTGRWKEPGDNADFKRLGEYCAPNPDGSCSPVQARTRPTSRFVQDYNRLDIAAVNVDDNFRPSFLDKLGLRRLKIGVNMNEVATFSSVQIERGTQYPYARNLTFSLNATF